MTETATIGPVVEPLYCTNCGAQLVANAGDAASCHACGRSNRAAAENHAAAPAPNLPEKLKAATEAWIQYEQGGPTLPARVTATVLPYAIFLFGIHEASTYRSGLVVSGTPIPMSMVGLLLWTLVGAALARGLSTMRLDVSRSGIPVLRLALSALPPVVPNGPPRCRQCNAPLRVAAGDPVAVCRYCTSESLARADAVQARAMAAEVEAAGGSIETAIAAERNRASHQAFHLRWAIPCFLVLSIAPFSWFVIGPMVTLGDGELRSWWVSATSLSAWFMTLLLSMLIFLSFFPPETWRGKVRRSRGGVALVLVLAILSIYARVAFQNAFIAGR